MGWGEPLKPSLRAGQGSSPAHPSQGARPSHGAHGMGQCLSCPLGCPLGLAASPGRGAAPRGAASRSIPRDQCGHSPGRKAGSATGPSESSSAAACFLLLPRRLRKSFCLHLSCKNRKNPTVLGGTSPASESIFPASAGNKTINESLQQRRGRHAGPRAHRCPGLGSLPACMATSTGRAGNALPESASQLPAAHPRSNAPRRLLSRSRDPITAPETGQGRSSPNRGESCPPPRRGAGKSHPTLLLCSGFFLSNIAKQPALVKSTVWTAAVSARKRNKKRKGTLYQAV